MLEQILAEEVLIAAVWYRLVSLEIVLDTPPPLAKRPTIGPGSHYRGFVITLRHTNTVGRTPLDE